MILLDTEQDVFIARDYADLVSQLLEHLDIRNDDSLASFAAACLGGNELDVMIVHTPK